MLLLVDITSMRDSTLHWCSGSFHYLWHNFGRTPAQPRDYRLILACSQVHHWVEDPPSNVGEHTLTPGSAQTNCRLKGTGRSTALLFGPSVWLLLARCGVLGFPARGGFALVVHSFGGDEELGAELYWDDNVDNTDNIGDACIDDISCDDNSHDDAAFLVGGGFGRPLMACRNSG